MARKRGLVRRTVTAKALAGAGRGWTALALAMFGARLAKRVLGRQERVILREELPAGASLLIRNLHPPDR